MKSESRVVMRRFGQAVVGVATVGVTLGAMVVAPQAASADDTLFNVAGNFYGDDRDEVIQYRQEGGADYTIEFSKSGGFISANPYTLEIGAAFFPFAGDFDGDGYDEIYWNRAPTGNDYMWNMSGPTDQVSTTYVMDGFHYTAVGDFTGDGADDILWYVPGAGADHIWEFDVGGTHTSHTLTVGGDYRPVAGNFMPGAGDEIVWYGPGTTPDSIWQFTPGTLSYTSTGIGPISEVSYQPYALDTQNDGYDDLYWYAPGAEQEVLWDYTAAGLTTTVMPAANNEYELATGDLFSDGHDDLLAQGITTTISDWHPGASGVEVTYWSFGSALRAVEPTGSRRTALGPVIGTPSGPPA